MKDPTEAQLKKVMASLGRKGGPARAEALTPERRKEIAKAAAKKRWDGVKKKKGEKS